jgi:hypothetical protein
VEQRIGQKKISPVDVAVTTDPAYVPGITAPRPVNSKDAAHEDAEQEPQGEAVTKAEAGTESTEAESQAEGEAESEAEVEADVEDEGSETEAADGDGPEFTISDRRGSITVDRTGVHLRLDDQAAEFRWEEIGAVEYGTSRFGRRLTVTVHTPGNRWYPADVEAPDKKRLKEWTERIDEALDAYFQE